MPVAVNCCTAPNATVEFSGLIAIDDRAAELPEIIVDPLIEPKLTLIVVLPAVSMSARPAVAGVSLIVATDGTVELQRPICVRFCVVPSLNVPVAVKGWVVPG